MFLASVGKIKFVAVRIVSRKIRTREVLTEGTVQEQRTLCLDYSGNDTNMIIDHFPT
jgi:hypothetical protein